jgi:hypothetical protein
MPPEGQPILLEAFGSPKQKYDLATNQLAIGPDSTKFKTALNCCRYERRKL